MTVELLLILTLCLLSMGFSQLGSKPRLVGNVSDSALVDGCGCYFSFGTSKKTSDKYMFAESIEENVGIWMNVDGRDIRLKAVKEWGTRARERVGSKSTRTFAADDNISVTSTYVVTRVCAASDENCESTDYAATFIVRKGNRVERVKASGYCGC